LWFKISVHHSVSVTICSGLENLISEFLYCFWWQWSSNLPHILFEIILTVFKDEIKVVLLIDNFLELNYIWVFDAFQQGDFTNGCAWNTVVFFFKLDFFEGNDLSCFLILGLVDYTVGTLSKLIKLVVFVKTTFCGLHF